MKNKQKKKCMFPKVSHFIFESFIYITGLSGVIKGTASYTYHPFFRLWRSKCFFLLCVWAPVSEICVPPSRLFPHFGRSLEGLQAQRETLLILNRRQREEKQHDPFHPAGLLSLLGPLKMVRNESTVFSSLSISKLLVFQHPAQIPPLLRSFSYPSWAWFSLAWNPVNILWPYPLIGAVFTPGDVGYAPE